MSMQQMRWINPRMRINPKCSSPPDVHHPLMRITPRCASPQDAHLPKIRIAPGCASPPNAHHQTCLKKNRQFGLRGVPNWEIIELLINIKHTRAGQGREWRHTIGQDSSISMAIWLLVVDFVADVEANMARSYFHSRLIVTPVVTDIESDTSQ